MQHYLASAFSEYTARLHDFIFLCSDARGNVGPANDSGFSELAIKLFQLQFEHNAVYREFCERRKIVPQAVKNWRHIPAFPASGFKELDVTSLPASERLRVFHSSGTTEQVPSRHFHSRDSLSLYEDSLLSWFTAHLLPLQKMQKRASALADPHGGFENSKLSLGNSGFDLIALVPPAAQAPNSSLVHMFETIRRELGSSRSAFTGQTDADGSWSLNFDKTIELLRKSIASDAPLILLGTAFSYVHLLDYLNAKGMRFHLPHGSRALETGGYKGRSRNMPKTELHQLITDSLGIACPNIICEYGMSELGSQAYDSVEGVQNDNRVFHFPPWARTQIISPETGREVGEGETGLIRIFDLANVYSVMAIQTEDIGIRYCDGFELLGRAAMVENRGCSLQSA